MLQIKTTRQNRVELLTRKNGQKYIFFGNVTYRQIKKVDAGVLRSLFCLFSLPKKYYFCTFVFGHQISPI